MKNVSHGSGNVMVNQIVEMDQMNRPVALHVTVEREHTSVRMETAQLQPQFAMELMTVQMALMRRTVISHVQI